MGHVAGVVQHREGAEHVAKDLEARARLEGDQAVAGHLEHVGQPAARDVAGDENRAAVLAGRLETEDARELDVLELGEARHALAQGDLDTREHRIEVKPLDQLAGTRVAPLAHTEAVAKDHAFFRRFREVCYFHRARPFRVSKAAAITRIALLVLQRPHQTCRS